MTTSKFIIIIQLLILAYNTPIAVASGFLVTPSNGTYEVNKTIEKLIATNERLNALNQKSSQKIEEMTAEIQRLTERLVQLTIPLVMLTFLLLAPLFKGLLYRKKQNTISKNEKKDSPDYRVRIRRSRRKTKY